MGDSRDPSKSPESGVIESKRRNRAAAMIREERGWASLEQTGVGRPLLKLSPKKLVTETRPAGCRRKYLPEGDQGPRNKGRASPVQSGSFHWVPENVSTACLPRHGALVRDPARRQDACTQRGP